jgi:Tol biopolymer transport system component
VCLLFIGTILAASTTVVAPKPEKPDKPGGPEPTGTVFFKYYDGTETAVWTMNVDGSDKTKTTTQGWGEKPLSRIKCGGHYWFLEFRTIENECYPDDLPRRELYAVRDDNTKTVQLTNDPNLAPDHRRKYAIWGHDNSYITWPAMKWIYDTSWEVEETQAGIFNADLTFDTNGDITGADTPYLLWLTDLTEDNDGYTVPTTGALSDWSPDGIKIVRYKQGLNVLDLNEETETVLTSGTQAQWSPDGNKIAFIGGPDDVRTINADGSNEQIVAKPKEFKKLGTFQNLEGPRWSPDSNFLIYERWQHSSQFIALKHWIHRVDADGDQDTCLTKNLPAETNKNTVGWR